MGVCPRSPPEGGDDLSARQSASQLGNQALILQDRGELDEAMALMKEQERICRELGDPNGLAISLANQGVLLVKMGQGEEAPALVQEAHRIASEHGLISLAQQVESDPDLQGLW